MQKVQKLAGILKERFTGADVTATSVMIAYYLLLSIFPLTIAVGNLLSMFKIESIGIMGFLETIVPKAVLPLLQPILANLLETASGGLLSISLVGAIWSAGRGVRFIRKGVNKAYGLPESGSFITRRLFSFFIIVLILLLLVVVALVYSFGVMLLAAIQPTFSWAGVLLQYITGLKWPVTLAALFLLMVLVYRVVPDVKLRVCDVLPGAGLTTVGLLLLVQGFTIYLRFATQSLSSYGALGTFFVLMFWLNFSAKILIFGAVLNASIMEYRFGKAEMEKSGVDNAFERTRNNLLLKLQDYLAARKQKKNGGAPPPEEASPGVLESLVDSVLEQSAGQDAEEKAPEKQEEDAPAGAGTPDGNG